MQPQEQHNPALEPTTATRGAVAQRRHDRSPPVRRAVALAVLLMMGAALPLVVESGTITDNDPGAGLRRYRENFDSLPLGSTPVASFYTFTTAGSGSQLVQNAPSGLTGQSWSITDSSAAYAVQLQNTGTAVDLCTSGQSLSFGGRVEDLALNEVLEYRSSASAVSTSQGIANSIFVRFTGQVGTTNTVNYGVRGATGVETLSAAGSITAGSVFTMLFAQVNCSNFASANFTDTGITSLGPTVSVGPAASGITGPLNRVGVAKVAAPSGTTSYFDDYDWQGAPIPAAPAPIISSVSPSSAYPGGQAAVFGSGFLQDAQITVGQQSVVEGNVTGTRINFTVPSHFPGTYSVTVTNPDGGNGTLANALTIFARQFTGSCANEEATQYEFFLQPVGDIPVNCWYDFAQINVEQAFVSNDDFFSDWRPREKRLGNDTQSLKIVDSGTDGWIGFQVNRGQDYCSSTRVYNLGAALNIGSGITKFGVVQEHALTSASPFTVANAWSTWLELNVGVNAVFHLRTSVVDTASTLTGFIPQPDTWYHVFFGFVCRETRFMTTNGSPLPEHNVNMFVFNANGELVATPITIARPTSELPTTDIRTIVLENSVGQTVFLDDINSFANPYVEDQRNFTGNVNGFDAAPGGETLIVREGTTDDIYSLDNGFNNLGVDTADNCVGRLYGVVAINTAVGWVSCPGGDKHLTVRDRYLDPLMLDEDYEEGFLTLDTTDGAVDPFEIAAVASLPLDLTGTESGSSGFFDVKSTQAGFVFSEIGTGRIGLFLELQRNTLSNERRVEYAQFAGTGNTVTQICSYGFDPDGQGSATREEYIAAVYPGVGVGLWRLTVTNPHKEQTDIRLTQIIVGDSRLQTAAAISCNANRIAIATTAGQIFLVRGLTDNQGPIGSIIEGTIFDEAILLFQIRGLALSGDGRWLISIEDVDASFSNIAVWDLTDSTRLGELAVSWVTAAIVSDTLITARVDTNANYLFVADQNNVKRYPIYRATNLGVANFQLNPDFDGDGIIDPSDPNPTEQDCDNDGIVDGEDNSVTCQTASGATVTYNGTALATCTANPSQAICTARPQGDAGTGGNGGLFNFSLRTSIFASIGVILSFAMLGYTFTVTRRRREA